MEAYPTLELKVVGSNPTAANFFSSQNHSFYAKLGLILFNKSQIVQFC